MHKKRRAMKSEYHSLPASEYTDGSRRRSKIEWAGILMSDGFKSYLPYYVRMPAQSQFYQLAGKVQRAAAKQAGSFNEADFKAAVQPQLGPCYTSYPSPLMAAYAAIGLTGYLEFEARARATILLTYLREYLANPASIDRVQVEPAIYQRIAQIVAQTVQTRLLLEDLARVAALSSLEPYRLFSAAQQNLQFRSLPDILHAVILYGDVLPDWRELPRHPLTGELLAVVTRCSRSYLAQLATTGAHKLIDLGAAWVRELCRSLAPYLPEQQSDHEAVADELSDEAGLPGFLRRLSDRMQEHKKPAPAPVTDEFAPLDGPAPPSLFDPPSVTEQITQALADEQSTTVCSSPPVARNQAEADDPVAQACAAFNTAIDKATGQTNQAEDMRFDLLEQALQNSGFRPSPIEGNPTEGHAVTVHLGNQETSEQLYDRPVALSDDFLAYEKLRAEAQPITEALRRSLYPNIEELPETERFRTTGALDPVRLALAEFSPVIFQRHRMHERADKRGRPVLLIACDGSASLTNQQMHMTKLLAAAWLNSTARTGVQVLAGLYHSGMVRPGLSGPLVQWMYHPRKTPAINRTAAARALISLPDTGTGAQKDALSLAFMLKEAYKIARGKMVYLILISDCAWNQSCKTSRSGKEEMLSFFQSAYEDQPGKLHTTLVALGVNDKTGFETMLDRVITVSQEQLVDCPAVAAQIGLYVASCMRERQRLTARR